MVDLSGGPEGPIEHGFSNAVFIFPALIVVGLSGKTNIKIKQNIDVHIIFSFCILQFVCIDNAL